MNINNNCFQWISSLLILSLIVDVTAKGGGRGSSGGGRGSSSGGRSSSSGSSRSSSSSSSNGGSSYSGSSYGGSNYAGSSSGYYSGSSSGIGSSISSSGIGDSSFGRKSASSNYDSHLGFGANYNNRYSAGGEHIYVPVNYISQPNSGPKYTQDTLAHISLLNYAQNSMHYPPVSSYHGIGSHSQTRFNEETISSTSKPEEETNYLHSDHEQSLKDVARKLFAESGDPKLQQIYKNMYGNNAVTNETENSIEATTIITTSPINSTNIIENEVENSTDIDLITTTMIEINPTNFSYTSEEEDEENTDIFNSTENSLNIFVNETSDEDFESFTNVTDVDDNDDATTEQIITINKTINPLTHEKQMLVENSANFHLLNGKIFVMISAFYGLSLSLSLNFS